LNYIKPSIHESVVKIPKEVSEPGSIEWNNALVGYLIEKKPTIHESVVKIPKEVFESGSIYYRMEQCISGILD